MDFGFDYAANYPLELESDYPYLAKEGYCNYDDTKAESKIKGFADVRVGRKGPDALRAALMKGPVSVAIEADQVAFQQYTGGVIT